MNSLNSHSILIKWVLLLSPCLEMRKLRLQEVEGLAHGFTASKWQSQAARWYPGSRVYPLLKHITTAAYFLNELAAVP